MEPSSSGKHGVPSPQELPAAKSPKDATATSPVIPATPPVADPGGPPESPIEVNYSRVEKHEMPIDEGLKVLEEAMSLGDSAHIEQVLCRHMKSVLITLSKIGKYINNHADGLHAQYRSSVLVSRKFPAYELKQHKMKLLNCEEMDLEASIKKLQRER